MRTIIEVEGADPGAPRSRVILETASPRLEIAAPQSVILFIASGDAITALDIQTRELSVESEG